MSRWKTYTAAGLLAAVFVFVSFAAQPVPAGAQSADEWWVKSFSSDYYINPAADGSMDVTETIETYFNVQKHGIYRYIPTYYDGGEFDLGVDLDVKIKSVTDSENGRPIPYEEYKSDGYVNLKIGDPNKFVYGDNTYVIKYSMKNAIRFYEDHEELYMDVNGTDWPVSFDKVSATVHLPENMRDSIKDKICFAGSFGDSEQDCTITYDAKDGVVKVATISRLSDYQNLSFDLSFESGTFTPPAFWDKWGRVIKQNIGILLPLLTFAGAYKIWDKYGRDPKSRGVIVPEYTPPKDLRPAELGTVADYNADDRDISATIIDLAIRGYIKIEDTTGSQKKKNRKYTFHLLKDDLTGLKEYEKEIITGLFTEIKPGAQVKLSSLKEKFYTTVAKVKETLYKSLVDRGYFATNPNTSRNLMRGVGVGALSVGLFMMFSMGINYLGWTLGLALSGVVLMIFSRWMPKRTVKGLAAWEYAEGLKEYMSLAEKERLKVMQGADSRYVGDTTAPKYTVELFEKLLPYAIVMNVEESWAKKFKDIYSQPPDWYQGDWKTFNTIYMIDTLSHGINTMNSTLTSAPSSSSSSGFSSGGGFSGGGFGGGGGGSW